MKRFMLMLLVLALVLMPPSALGEGEEATGQAAEWFELSENQEVLTVRLPVEEGWEWQFDISEPAALELITMETVALEDGMSQWVASFRAIDADVSMAVLDLSRTRVGEEPQGIHYSIVVVVEEDGIQIFSALEPKLFYFMSGAGGWSTELTLNPDGKFEGFYHDSEMGITGNDYPNGTLYYCSFSGQFTEREFVDECTISMKVEDIQIADEPDTEEIIDGIQYIAAEPYGLEAGETFLVYVPETPIEGLDEDFLSWWPYRYEREERDTLGCWGLYNQEMGYGFFTYE